MKRSPCSWCCGESSLNIGAGSFRDFDFDYSYGLPICGGCGGLGIQVDDEEFRRLTKEIIRLRFEYCPTGDMHLCPDLPFIVRLQKYKALQAVVVEIFGKFAESGNECYAKDLIGSGFAWGIEQLEKASQVYCEVFEREPENES